MALSKSMADTKFEGPGSTSNIDPGKFVKLAQRVENVLAKETVNHEPRCIDPNLVLVSPNNRLKASPNVCHIHGGILSGVKVNGFDRQRPPIGICVEVK